MKKPSDIVEELRVGIDMSEQQSSQIVYEKWLKLEQWEARRHAAPLIVGCDPDHWQAYLAEHGLLATEELLWHIISNDLSVASEDSISVSAVTEWARVQTVALHPSFLRIYEFVRKVMLTSVASDGLQQDDDKTFQSQRAAEQPVADMRVREREIILGAALSLLSKMPEKCRDSNGFADGSKIVALIEQTAVKWFPGSPPAMSKSEMIGLIDKWLE